MLLNQLRPKVKQSKRVRLGRGGATGLGKQSGRGQKGTGARSGRHMYIGFTGAQMRIMRKIPKIGFNVYKRNIYQIVNLGQINKAIKKEISQITPEILKQAGLVKSSLKPVKILSDGELKRPFSFQGCSASQAALKKIKDSGGQIVSEKNK
jgi:large subunit ribosomal protein L15